MRPVNYLFLAPPKDSLGITPSPPISVANFSSQNQVSSSTVRTNHIQSLDNHSETEDEPRVSSSQARKWFFEKPQMKQIQPLSDYSESEDETPLDSSSLTREWFFEQFPGTQDSNFKNNGEASSEKGCMKCGANSTPQWRNSPNGLEKLCNACGLSDSKHRKKEEASIKFVKSKNRRPITFPLNQMPSDTFVRTNHIQSLGDYSETEDETPLASSSQARKWFFEQPQMKQIQPLSDYSESEDETPLASSSLTREWFFEQFPGTLDSNFKNNGEAFSEMGCMKCGTKSTPKWRGGHNSLEKLCNACGISDSKQRKNEKTSMPLATDAIEEEKANRLKSR